MPYFRSSRVSAQTTQAYQGLVFVAVPYHLLSSSSLSFVFCVFEFLVAVLAVIFARV